MTEMEKQIKRIMEAPVSGLVKLTDSQFNLVLALLVAARLEVKPVEIKRKGEKHGKKSS